MFRKLTALALISLSGAALAKPMSNLQCWAKLGEKGQETVVRLEIVSVGFKDFLGLRTRETISPLATFSDPTLYTLADVEKTPNSIAYTGKANDDAYTNYKLTVTNEPVAGMDKGWFKGEFILADSIGSQTLPLVCKY